MTVESIVCRACLAFLNCTVMSDTGSKFEFQVPFAVIGVCLDLFKVTLPLIIIGFFRSDNYGMTAIATITLASTIAIQQSAKL